MCQLANEKMKGRKNRRKLRLNAKTERHEDKKQTHKRTQTHTNNCKNISISPPLEGSGEVAKINKNANANEVNK